MMAKRTRSPLPLLAALAVARASVCAPLTSKERSPIYHILGNTKDGGLENINDASGIVLYKGVWHVFHQCCQNHWDHVVSEDLAHWTRVPPPLVPNATDPAQWYDAHGSWDGSISLLPEGPTILYDVVEGAPPGGKLGGDPPTMAIARAKDADDPYLVEWVKDPRNPIDWNGTTGTSFASGIMKSGDHWNFFSEGYRYETRDETFHVWNRAENLFGAKANGGQWFFDRPSAPDGVPADPDPKFTHVIASGTGLFFQLGTYVAENETWAHYALELLRRNDELSGLNV